ncbi:MAG: methyltransferase family protein [Promethearchaeota archaeon]
MKCHQKMIKRRESTDSHLIRAVFPISFIINSHLDTFIFRISVGLNEVVPFISNLILSVITLGIVLILIELAHDALFSHNQPSNTLITNGILNHVRNPMYLRVLLIYMAFLFLSISRISLDFFIVVILIFNKIVNYEEKVLEELFGDNWLAYKRWVPQWIPK